MRDKVKNLWLHLCYMKCQVVSLLAHHKYRFCVFGIPLRTYLWFSCRWTEVYPRFNLLFLIAELRFGVASDNRNSFLGVFSFSGRGVINLFSVIKGLSNIMARKMEISFSDSFCPCSLVLCHSNWKTLVYFIIRLLGEIMLFNVMFFAVIVFYRERFSHFSWFLRFKVYRNKD